MLALTLRRKFRSDLPAEGETTAFPKARGLVEARHQREEAEGITAGNQFQNGRRMKGRVARTGPVLSVRRSLRRKFRSDLPAEGETNPRALTLTNPSPFRYNFRPEDPMPANLPPEYHEIEKELRTARTPQEKIDIYERLISVIPHHKGTDKLIAMYRAKIAKAKDEMQRRPGTARRGPSYRVDRSGAGQVILVGPPNSGKSLLVEALTGAQPEVADYPFTTRMPAPFMMPFENVQIQLLDTPPVTGEMMESWFPEIVKIADAVLFVLDGADSDFPALLDGILRRLRDRKVDFVAATEDIPADRFPFLKRSALAFNKSDLEGARGNLEDLDVLLETPFEKLPVSALTGEGIEDLRRRLFDLLRIVRVYSKIPGKKADRETPFILKKGSNLRDAARAVHKDFADKLSYARVWNRSGLEGLRVNRDYVLRDEDILELHL